jgi:tripartite-type tricarboxylate transporter receptor subunit TctC
VLLAHPSFPARTVPELLALARSKPGELQYASAGNGTLNHLLGEMLNQMAGVQLQHVPYKGVAPALNDVGGQLPLLFGSLPSTLQYIKSGKLRALAVSSAARSPLLPDVPSLGEFVPGYNGTLWIALFAPRGLPPAVMSRLREGMQQAAGGQGHARPVAGSGRGACGHARASSHARRAGCRHRQDIRQMGADREPPAPR